MVESNDNICEPSLTKIYAAAAALKSKILRTPLIYSATMSNLFGGQIYLKLENLQRTGSFKIRGATFKLLQSRHQIGPEGVVAASAGNHAQGVALAASSAGIKASIVMPQWASITKQEATRSYGGQVIIHGQSVTESLEFAQEMAAEGKTFIHPFDDPEIIAGQGTIGLEILEELPDVNMVIAPAGGGGLLAGLGLAIKSVRPGAVLIGVQAKACPSIATALQKGRPITVAASPSVADGISVKRMGLLPFKALNRFLDDLVLVEENEIIAAMLMLLERKKILAEGAGAASLAALISRGVPITDRTKVVLVISGGNVDSSLLDRIIHRGLIENGRLMRLRVMLDDLPGSLAKLLEGIAELGANVLHIQHERNNKEMPLYTTLVKLDLETRGASHIEKIAQSIQRRGYQVLD